MLPPFSGGLHCGRNTSTQILAPTGHAPAVQRRLHCGINPGTLYGQRWLVLPPSGGGLHCSVVPAGRW